MQTYPLRMMHCRATEKVQAGTNTTNTEKVGR